MPLDFIDDNLALVITTESDCNKARKLANYIIKMKLSKCVSLSNIDSIYHWENNIEEAKEVQLTIKTSLELLDELIKALKNKHSYEIPQIICLRASSSKEYKEWLSQPI